MVAFGSKKEKLPPNNDATLTDSVEKFLQHKLEVGLASMMCVFL